MVNAAQIARGDASGAPRLHDSPIEGVTPIAWTKLVRTLSTQPLNAIAVSGALGSYEMRPRRLADLGLMTGVRRVERGGVRVWRGTFVLPLTEAAFLRDKDVQYDVLVRSVLDHLSIAEARPDGVTLSGALALLHRAGPEVLRTWGVAAPQFDSTARVFERANGIF